MYRLKEENEKLRKGINNRVDDVSKPSKEIEYL